MKILLDENFPLALVQTLRDEGLDVEHVILLGLRGAPDTVIVARLTSEKILFLTQDQDFLELPLTQSAVVVSRVSQSLPQGYGLDAWRKAVIEYFSRDWEERLFEVFDDGRLLPWKVKSAI